MDMVIIFLAYLISLIFTAVLKSYLLRKNLLDQPNERSSHKVPTPRGGGWALVSVLIPGLLITSLLQHNLPQHAYLLTGIVLLVFISWMDDRKGIPPIIRLALHLLAAFLGTLSLPTDAKLFGGVLPIFIDRALLVIGWAWFINLYNFMDGIDGITGVETISIATGIGLILTFASVNDPFVATLTLLLTGSCLGFLAYNWQPAKIFLGDVGSVPLGYLTGYGLILLAVMGHPIPALILPLYYIADSGITIVKRALRGEKIWQAHRQHFYQRAAMALCRHDKVVLQIIFANIGLVTAAILAIYYPWTGLTIAVLIVALLLWNMHNLLHGSTAT